MYIDICVNTYIIYIYIYILCSNKEEQNPTIYPLLLTLFMSLFFVLFFYLFNFYCIFPLLLVSPMPSSTTTYPPAPTITTLLSVSISPFSFRTFCLVPPPLPPSPFLPPGAVRLLSIYESVSIFFVSSVCSLDSSYE